MVKIYLTKREKALLRAVAEGTCPKRKWPMFTLQDKGLIHTAREEGGEIADASLTLFGREYLAANPKLKNPLIGDVDWETALIVLVFILLGVLVLALIGFLVKSLFFK